MDTPIVPVAVTRAVAQRQMELWRNTWEDGRVAALVAKALSDDAMIAEAKKQMERSLRAIAELERLVADVKG
jgi:tellurite resistance protein